MPELAGAAAGELDDLRAACRAALDTLLATDHDTLLVVGGADTTSAYGGPSAGSLQPWGVDVRVGAGQPVLPLSLTIGRWLLDREPDAFQSVAFDAEPAACLALGASLVAEKAGLVAEKAGLMAGRRVAMLVMADGSACLTEKAPGFLDQAALPYNELIGVALGGADAEALAALDPVKAARLWVGGRSALQVLAGAAGERSFDGRLLADVAPYGVGYFVASWT